MRLARHFLMALAVLGISVLAGSAGALEIGFTVDAPIAFTAGGTSGTVDPYVGGPLNGLAPGIDCLVGACDVTTQDWMVFTVSVTSGSLNDLGVGALFIPGVAMGYFLDGGPIQDGTGLTDTYTGSLAAPNTPTFTFLANGGGAGLTGTSLVLFVAYADGALPTDFPVADAGTTQFMLTEFGAAGIDGPQGTVTTEVDIVPEPSTALLLFGGLLILGARSSRRNRS